MSRAKKIGLAVGGLALAGTIAAVAVTAGRGSGPAVRVDEIARRPLVSTVTANGWIRPRRSVEVQADIMGRVVELQVREGDRVQAGDLLLRIDPTQYEAAVARARAAVSESRAREAQARAGMLRAERALERLEQMRARDTTLVSGQSLEDAASEAEIQRALHEAARHGVEQATASLREAEDQLAKTVIRAPIDGVVTRLNVEEGETAIVGTMNNPGSLLLTVSDLSVMEAVVQVDETDVPMIELGDSAGVTIDAFQREAFAGRVTEIGHSAIRSPESAAYAGQQQQAVDFEVVITLDDPPAVLRPDLSATAEVVTATRDDALTVPIIALTVRERELTEMTTAEVEAARRAQTSMRDGRIDREGVFLLTGGTVRFVPVEIGIAGQEYFEVLSGLGAGDSVVAGPYDVIQTLEDDQAVRIMTEAEIQAAEEAAS